MITYLWVCATWLTISKHNRTPPHLVISYVAILCCTKTSGLVTFTVVMLHSGGFHLWLEMSAPGFVCVCFRKPLWERQWLRQHSAVCGKNDRPTLLWRQLASLITNCCDSSLVYKTHPHLSTHCAFINDVTILWCSDISAGAGGSLWTICGMMCGWISHPCLREFGCWIFCLLQSAPSSAPTVTHKAPVDLSYGKRSLQLHNVFWQ